VTNKINLVVSDKMCYIFDMKQISRTWLINTLLGLSVLTAVGCGDGEDKPENTEDTGVTTTDTGSTDTDTDSVDTDTSDTGSDTDTDSVDTDTGSVDTDTDTDTGSTDTGITDTGSMDTGIADTGSDTGTDTGSDTGSVGLGANAVADFSLIDVNLASSTAGQNISPRDYLQQISGWYFIKAT